MISANIEKRRLKYFIKKQDQSQHFTKSIENTKEVVKIVYWKLETVDIW